MKLAMVGSGAMGLRYGVLLAEQGNDVTFVDMWQPHLDAVHAQGGVYVMRDHKGRHLVPVKMVTPEEYHDDPDMFVFFTKQMQLADYLKRMAHAFKPHQYAFTCMNGMGHVEKLQRYFADDKIIGGTALVATVLPGPGEVDFMGKRGAGMMNMCPLNEKPDAMCQELFKQLDKAQFHPTMTDDFTGTLMTKVVFNSVMNSICTMFELQMGQFGRFPGFDTMAKDLLDEAYDVCGRADIHLVESRADMLASLEHNCQVDMPLYYPSMYQDMSKDRPTEVDYINGYIAKLGKKYDYVAHTQQFVTQAVHLAEFHRQELKAEREKNQEEKSVVNG